MGFATATTVLRLSAGIWLFLVPAAEREWAYDRESPIGRLDKALDEAAANGWIVVSMKGDWKRVFPFEQ